MNRTEKITRLHELERGIKQKKVRLEKEKRELEILQEKYNKTKESELPLLLFLIDETLAMPEDKSDWQYEHVYYCPDIDEVKYIINHSEKEQLHNTVDLRDNFSSLGIPTKAYTRSALDYTSEINMAVSMLKPQIDNLFTSNEIHSWSDLGTVLKKEIEESNIRKFKKKIISKTAFVSK